MKLTDYNPHSEAITKHTALSGPKYPIFDFHTHMGKLLLGDNFQDRYDTNEYIASLRKVGVIGAVNLDGFYGDDLRKMNEKIGDTDFFVNFMWIDFDRFEEDDFQAKTKELILNAYTQGCRGIKMWKDISLYKKLRTDDPKMDVIYDTAAELGIVILMHIADPVAFFKPLNETNERYEELSQNPDWHFADRDAFMSFEELMEMQENTIRNHPKTKFVIAHVGSYAENLGWVSEQLTLYPNMMIDIAARIAELGRVPYTARRFLIKHQDRILFGTDCSPLSSGIHELTYRFLETDDEYFSYEPNGELPGQGRWSIYGINLPDEVLQKVYNRNALRLLNLETPEVK